MVFYAALKISVLTVLSKFIGKESRPVFGDYILETTGLFLKC